MSGQLWSSFADSNEQIFKELLSTEPPPPPPQAPPHCPWEALPLTEAWP